MAGHPRYKSCFPPAGGDTRATTMAGHPRYNVAMAGAGAAMGSVG